MNNTKTVPLLIHILITPNY